MYNEEEGGPGDVLTMWMAAGTLWEVKGVGAVSSACAANLIPRYTQKLE